MEIATSRVGDGPVALRSQKVCTAEGGVSTDVDSANTTGQAVWPYYLLFFTSGCPALLYQIVWERVLFTIYGVNIQSVTMIVTVFMLGLGLGSLAGGKLSRRLGANVVRAFAFIELSIGAFGLVSLTIFHWVARFTAGAPIAATGVVAFLLLLIPTLLMGSTLPLLVEHFVQRTGNIGESIAALYSVNTLGSALACYAAALFVMRRLGEAGSVRLAVGLNLVVGLAALLLASERTSGLVVTSQARSYKTIPFSIGMVLSGTVGFVSLAYEIVWYRLYSFASGGTAPSFAMLLACYLAGIAYGAFAVRGLCREKFKNDLRLTLETGAFVVIIGNVAAFLVGPALAFFIRFIPYAISFVFVFVAAALLGAAFPILAQAAIDPNQCAGSRMSYLYLSNILGCTLGSFLIGFVFMDHWTIRTISLLLLGAGSLAAAILAVLAKPIRVSQVTISGFTVAFALAFLSPSLFSGVYERLLFKDKYVPGTIFKNVVENRSGVIAVTQDDTVIGGGVYDGHFNTDLVNDVNGIYRAYMIAGLHPNPAQVLMIGLSSGSWAQVIVNNPRVQHFTAVEINPGYLRLIQDRPFVASLLRNPKVDLAIDDGRRWLIAHPDRKFDLIVMNTSFSWRANITNLLAVEMLQMFRSHLYPGGIVFYNTTWSGDVQLTGATVFPYVIRIGNFLAVSDSPIVLDGLSLRTALLNYKIDGHSVLDASREQDRLRLEWILRLATGSQRQASTQGDEIETRQELLARWKNRRLVTDDNMVTEWP
jgi:spermidine synthase